MSYSGWTRRPRRKLVRRSEITRNFSIPSWTWYIWHFVVSSFPVSLQTRGKDLDVHYYLVTLSFPFNPSLARINTNANWLQCNSQKKTHFQLWIELKTISTILITRKTPKRSTILWIKKKQPNNTPTKIAIKRKHSTLSFQAMAIKEQIGYPDYILEDQNEKLDLEYANVSILCISHRILQNKHLHLLSCHRNICTCATALSKDIKMNILINNWCKEPTIQWNHATKTFFRGYSVGRGVPLPAQLTNVLGSLFL